MEQFMKELQQAAERLYQAQIKNEETLGLSSNLIYEVSAGGEPAILRVSKQNAFREAHIRFELNWVEYLCRYMDSLAGPVKSINHRLMEPMMLCGEPWLLCVFRKAPGISVDPADPEQWNDTLFRSLGELMGQMHLHTQTYVKESGVRQEFDWQHNFLSQPKYSQWKDPDIQPCWEQLYRRFEAMSKDPQWYGIVHTDVHHLNYHVEEGRITLFDFDDCEFSWYLYDIASACFFAVNTAAYMEPEVRRNMAQKFLVPFLRSYLKTRKLPQDWEQDLELFIRYRLLVQYKFITNLYYKRENPLADHIVWLKEELLKDRPYLDLDYAEIKRQAGMC